MSVLIYVSKPRHWLSAQLYCLISVTIQCNELRISDTVFTAVYTRGIAIANGTCVSFCNQPKAHFSLPGYAPGTIAVISHGWKEDSILVKSIAACTHIFNRFPVIQHVSSKVHHFSTFLYILASPGYAPGPIAVNVTWMERGFNVGQTHSSMYPSIFNRFRAITRYWSEIATFSYPLAFSAPVGGSHYNSGKSLVLRKLESCIGLPGSEDRLTIGWAVSTQYQRVTDRRTDGQTDSPAYSNNVRSNTEAR